MRSHKLFKREDVVFVVSNANEFIKVRENFPDYNLILAPASREEYGLATIAKVRDFISQHLLQPDEWALLVDDNVDHLTRVSDQYYAWNRIDFGTMGIPSSEWRQIYATPADPYLLAEELIARCEQEGTIYGGLASEDNFYFRSTKWSRIGYTKTKFAVWKNDRSLRWHLFDGCMFEDFAMTCQVIDKYGGVLNNKFARMHNPYYEAGGIGTEAERRPHLEMNCAELMRRYDGLLEFARGEPFLLSFKIRSPKRIREWRDSRGWA